MRLPLDSYTLTQTFSNPPNHGGWDLATEEGTPIHSPVTGVVIGDGENASYIGGKYVIVRENASPRREFYMGHMSSNIVNNGQSVSEGQVIGYVGHTGQASGPHVHFQIREFNSGALIDPAKLFNNNSEGEIVIETSPPVFNARYYLNANPDVNKKYNVANAKDHWLSNGIKEGRNSAPNFHVKEYLANYPDLQKAYGKTGYAKALLHYYNNGINEGRSGVKRVPVIDKFSVLAEKVKALIPFTK